MPWWWGYTETVSPRPPHLHRISSLGSNVGGTCGLEPHALRRTAANRIDVAARLSVRTTAACRLFPSGEALPSTTSAGSCLPLFDRFLGTTTSSDFSPAYMLGVWLLPSRAGPAQVPGTGETSQVPRKELPHVHKVSDCARFFHASQYAMEDVAFSSAVRDRHLGIRPVYRGRDGRCWSPPAQIRACATNALGSYLECLTWNRWFGHGCSTRGDGRNRLISRIIRSHVSRCRWLRRRRLRNQMMLV